MRLILPPALLLAFWLSGAASPVLAQRSLHLGVQSGAGLSHNDTQSNGPLPGKVRTYDALSIAFNGTLTYRFNEHYALEAAAGWYLTHDGLRYGDLVYARTPDGTPLHMAGRHGSLYPVRQLRLHALRYLPFAQGKLVGVLGAGGSFAWGRFAEYAEYYSSYEAGAPEQEYVSFRLAPATQRRSGWLLGGQAGLEWRPAPRHTLALTAQYHLGLRPIYAVRTTEFVYSDAYRGVVETDHHARFTNRGSYGVLTLSYQRRLWAR
jgi:hypothetical protein